MLLIQILRRKDAFSLIVAIIIATVVWQALSFITSDLAKMISGLKQEESFTYGPPDVGWKQTYLYPVVWATLQIIFLEILARLVSIIGSGINKPAKRTK